MTTPTIIYALVGGIIGGFACQALFVIIKFMWDAIGKVRK